MRQQVHDSASKFDAVMKLAQLRYVKLVPGNHVDEMKVLHKHLNIQAAGSLKVELVQLLSCKVSAALMSEIIALVDRHLNIYQGVETEPKELAVLKKHVPVLKHYPRTLSNGGKAQDFMIDEAILQLLKYSRAAREQIFETLVSWRTKPPHTKDDPMRIIVDIPDGLVFRNHAIFGDQNRVSPEQALREKPNAPLRFAILLYADAFTVR